MPVFYPEGVLIERPDNQSYLLSLGTLEDAMREERILEARAILCDYEHNLIVDLGFAKGIIPRVQGAMGIAEGKTRDIALISRVNKPVCFMVTELRRRPDGSVLPVLSRRRAQEKCTQEFLAPLEPGDVIPGRVTHLEPFGAFVDIGCGLPSLIPIDQISVSRIAHPRDRFRPGDHIRAVVRSKEPDGKIGLGHKELLGTWQENADLFQTGETVAGIIRSVEDYGVFVELTPNLAGLAEPFPGVTPGQHASVYIKNIIPEKMKIKLIIVDAFEAAYSPQKLRYYIETGHITRWQYSTPSAGKVIGTVFM